VSLDRNSGRPGGHKGGGGPTELKRARGALGCSLAGQTGGDNLYGIIESKERVRPEDVESGYLFGELSSSSPNPIG